MSAEFTENESRKAPKGALGLGWVMEALVLRGRSILVVEDEPLIALDIVDCFRSAGASVLIAHRLEDGLRLAGHPDLSAAVLDFGLIVGECTAVCERLNERGIPFVLHSGYTNVQEARLAGTIIPKPADPTELVATIARLLYPEERAHV
jgi:DNA-binding response OmpR family regulator